MAFHLGWVGTYVQTSHDDHDDVVGRGAIDLVHDQTLTLTEARIGADVGLARGFGASLAWPVRMVSTTIRYLDSAGAPVELVEPGIHHRNETLTGLGDPMVMGSYGRGVGAWRLAVRAGASLPFGRTEEDPFALGDLGLAHEHIQMGTGTVNPVAAVEVARGWGPWRLGGFAFTQQVFYANGKGYQAGDRYAGGVSLRRHVGSRWTLRGGGEVQGETAERWGGMAHTDDGNRGRLDAMLGAGATWSVREGLAIDFGVKVPVVTRVVGGQLEMPAILEVGASWSFGAHHAHHHPHEEHADAALGTITIVDYWATWCEACKTLDPILEELARTHPGEVTLRRVDASDWDDYPFSMPHVTVLDAGGAELLDRSSEGDLDALVAVIRAIVDHRYVLVTEQGFAPADVRVHAGEPAVLVFERRTDDTCATEVVIDGATHPLPLGQPVSVPVTFAQPGTIPFSCGMDMVRGTITVDE